MTFEERKEQVKSYLGKRVVIGIDRPLGYIHKKDTASPTFFDGEDGEYFKLMKRI